MARGPQPICSILPELMARRGYTRVQGAAAYETAWSQAAGPLLARYSRVGSLRRGTLEVIAANSTMLQELGFQKVPLLAAMSRLLPDQGINNLRFRVGVIDPS
jgi:predicted nucleic acid-binding Zn ribbon protein